MDRLTLVTKPSSDYELVDSGREEKLERYGDIVLSRPDPQALWEKNLSEEEWAKADGKYSREGKEGEWKTKTNLPKEWEINFGGLKFIIKPTSFKHTGLFPEQLSNWDWAAQILTSQKVLGSPSAQPDHFAQQEFAPRVLNLFAYTGGATLAAAKAGAEVTHVDASKTAVAWARENAARSGLSEKPIHWITEDVLVFVKREIKRGNKYDLIIMDPPAFGHGPKDELWKIEESLLELMALSKELLSEKPLGILLNGYAAGYSSLAFAYNLEKIAKKFGGRVEHGDLTIEEKGSRRLLPCGIFARCKFA